MANILCINIQSIVWNSITMNATAGGPLEARVAHSGTVVESRTADDQYPRAVFVTDKSCIVGIKLQDVSKITIGPGDGPSNMVITYKQGGGSTTGSVLTIPNLVCTDMNSGQIRSQLQDMDLAFVHQSADGSTDPISVA